MDRQPFAARVDGGDRARRIARSPRLPGGVRDDEGADLSWRHFDHPTVFVFRRTGTARFLAAHPRAGIYDLRRWEEARQVVQRALAFEEFLFLEHCLLDALRHGREREDLIRGINDLLSLPEVLRYFDLPEAYVEEGGRWKLYLVARGSEYRVQLGDGRRVP